MPLSDSSETSCGPYDLGLLPPACWHRPAGVPEVSRFSCLKFLGVQGSSTTQGWRESRTFVSRHVAFRRLKSVGTLIGCFVGSRSGAVFLRSRLPGAPRFLWEWTH